MSREAFGDPPEPMAPRCPVCDGTEHTNDCELGEEMAKRRRCERELAEWREMALSQAGDAGLLARAVKAETEASLLRAAMDAELPDDLLNFMHGYLTQQRLALVGFTKLGNEVERTAKLDRWIAALQDFAGRKRHNVRAKPARRAGSA